MPVTTRGSSPVIERHNVVDPSMLPMDPFVRIVEPGSPYDGCIGLLLTDPGNFCPICPILSPSPSELPARREGELYVMMQSSETVAVHHTCITPAKRLSELVAASGLDSGLDEQGLDECHSAWAAWTRAAYDRGTLFAASTPRALQSPATAE